jgi:radical SAM/Cys-rich protein
MRAVQISQDQLRTGAPSFGRVVAETLGTPLKAQAIDTVQVNIGLRCNLACRHCHVLSSPKRAESMEWGTMCAVLAAARACGARTLDITGGAPEMHPHFEAFVDAALADGLQVMVRTNLTIMLATEYAHFPAFFATRGIHLVASLPCYLPNNVDRQRGRHVYRESIEVIQRLNAAGYGRDAGKRLDLVYNPGGPSLPPDQDALADAYRKALRDEFGIAFNELYTITNVPIGRLAEDLRRSGALDEYDQLLRNAFNPSTLDKLMCRYQLHVGWDGALYDCDALGLRAAVRGNIHTFDPKSLLQRTIATDSHCFACTAGCGSSCGGALA